MSLLPQDRLETIVDGARYPIAAEVARASGVGVSSRGKGDALGTCATLLSLGVYYDTLEFMWNRGLWLDWNLVNEEAEAYFVPNDVSREQQRAVGFYRHHALLHEVVMHAVSVWRQLPATRRCARAPRVVSIARNGKRKRLVVGNSVYSPESPPAEDLARLLAEELYLSNVLDEPLPLLAGVTARQMLSAWTGIAPLAELLVDRASTSQTSTKGSALTYAPILESSELRLALIRCAGITAEQAAVVQHALTMTKSPRHELWFRPFVPLSAERVIPVAPALSVGNLLRSIEN